MKMTRAVLLAAVLSLGLVGACTDRSKSYTPPPTSQPIDLGNSKDPCENPRLPKNQLPCK